MISGGTRGLSGGCNTATDMKPIDRTAYEAKTGSMSRQGAHGLETETRYRSQLFDHVMEAIAAGAGMPELVAIVEDLTACERCTKPAWCRKFLCEQAANRLGTTPSLCARNRRLRYSRQLR